MNLLFGKLYDPTSAVTAFTTSTTGVAIVAFDTTNLRATFTVPPSGYVRVRMSAQLHGATTFPTILYAVMSGSGIVARQQPMQSLGNTAVATAQVKAESDFIVAGLVAGEAKTWDAGYGIEVGVTATGVKYGGPNNTTANDAFGGFAFEVWDPCPFYTPTSGVPPTTPQIAYTSGIKTKTDFLPSATAGAAGGVQIAGTNAATVYASVTCSGAFSIGGVSNVAQTGDSFARIGAAGSGLTAISISSITTVTGNVLGTVASVSGLTAANLDATISSRMATYTQPGGFLTAVFPGTIASATNISVIGSVSGLTAANLDTTVSSRMATYVQPTGFLAASFPATVAGLTNITVVGAVSGLTAANLDATVSSRLASASYTAPDNSTITAIYASTSGLSFTVPGQVDSNAKSMNDTTIQGTGTALDLWRG
jgi:hypothetical protein